VKARIGSIRSFVLLLFAIVLISIPFIAAAGKTSTTGQVNVTLNKTDSADPVSPGQTFNYTILVNITQLDQPLTNISNLSLTDTYPSQVIFVSSQPTAASGNNTFILGNFSTNQTVQVNITVRVRSDVANGTLINNTVNISFQNDSSVYINITGVTENTTVAGITGCPATINDSMTLTQNIVSTTSCITIGLDNVTLDCAGFSITYGTGGASNVFGVVAASRKNITIANCTIVDGSTTGAFDIGINFTLTNDSTIINNTITTNGTSDNYGIALWNGSKRNLVANNTIFANGSSGNNTGIFINTTSDDNNITGNTIMTFGADTNVGIRIDTNSNTTLVQSNIIYTNGTAGSNYGIQVLNAFGTSILNNSITTNGTSGNAGVRLENSVNTTTVGNNTILTSGSAGNNFGIFLLSSVSASNFYTNLITTTGTGTNHGIKLQEFAENNTFYANNITATGTLSYGIEIINSNYSFFNHTILNNPTEWINTTGNSTRINFTNTSFWTGSGAIIITGTFFEQNKTINISRAVLNISTNKATLNATNLTFMNQSARIILLSVPDQNPTATVDFEDDGVFSDCSSSVCTGGSYTATGGVYVFDVTRFSSYSSRSSASGGSTSSGGGGGGGISARTYSMSTSNQTFTLKRNEKIQFSINSVTYAATVTELVPFHAILQISFQSIRLSKDAPQAVDVTGDGRPDVLFTLVGMTSYDATINTALIKAPACVESWACSGWVACINGQQTRLCTDQNRCGTTKLKPALTQSCVAQAAPEPASSTVPPPLPAQSAATVPRPALPEAQQASLTWFYWLAAIVVVALIAYWYFTRKK
jgi:hypothetical protein